MCGITGIYAFNKAGRQWMSEVGHATNALSLRGPDDHGVVQFPNTALGHTRLSILDTSDCAHQPMSDVSGRFTLIFNGEIYNFRQLRDELQQSGYTFTSTGDTEVLLYALIHWRGEALNKLNGFFAFAFYDSQQEELWIARDRYGIKPVLYYQDENAVVFGSEMRALLAYPIHRGINKSALPLYFHLNYTPGPHTMVRNVFKLLPGHMMHITRQGVDVTQYYDLTSTDARPVTGGYDDWKEQFLTCFEQAVQRRLVADVPLGAFLSGGIDSSAVVAMASRHVDSMNTFSIGFKDNKFFDETHYAALVAKKFRTNHTAFYLTQDDLYESFEDVLDHLDEPFADSSALLVNVLSKETRKYVTVALSGDGGDELFAGYNKHYGEWQAIHSGIKGTLLTRAGFLLSHLPKSRHSRIGNYIRKLDRFAEGLKMNPRDRYWRWAGYMSHPKLTNLFAPGFLDSWAWEEYTNAKSRYTRFITGRDINEILMADMHLVLPNDMLTKVDLMSMKNSLEVRVPFLDHELVAFACSLPDTAKINGKLKKRIVQDSLRNILPSELYNRPKKGFEVPLLNWLKGNLQERIKKDWLHPDFIEYQGIFNNGAIQEMLRQLNSRNPGDVHAHLYALIVFQQWWRKYIGE